LELGAKQVNGAKHGNICATGLKRWEEVVGLKRGKTAASEKNGKTYDRCKARKDKRLVKRAGKRITSRKRGKTSDQ